MHHLSHLIIVLSSILGALSADQGADVRVVNVPLTDPRITLVNSAHYNASLCGGAISLPYYDDSILFSFQGKLHISSQEVSKLRRRSFVR
ncbi:hypothetical protein M407DRAFT_23538 [Tulasnella calospora MUT 4182]|uniref:Uncharacterized protein n=1 Tax=Tulasnella calospora MUT 4182 TaxID=1051891 RepID=A0A0C3QJF7_9AGAM|nr:hypothetical protein M407DRAFT_23538 [Tulasnella calospora MUT 4182]